MVWVCKEESLIIKKHKSLTRAEQIINSFINSMYQNDNLDGVVEVFKEKDKQGYVMKLYKTYDPESDICLWVYEDLNRKTIHTIMGNHNNCDDLNCYDGDDLVYNQYPVVTDIKKKIVSNLVEYIYDHYGKDMRL